jgi:hypothetical protein
MVQCSIYVKDDCAPHNLIHSRAIAMIKTGHISAKRGGLPLYRAVTWTP